MILPRNLMTESSISNHDESGGDHVIAKDLGYNIAVKNFNARFRYDEVVNPIFSQPFEKKNAAVVIGIFFFNEKVKKKAASTL